ncbi:unnamed protein product [Phytophthora fragariaefolia]|uniref:Unnamed protein product n=1 Tax=Phytophthora fragariaefolia TaxID=1490495 RepID=A0A9W6XSH5_9STRA|nr:unnamed protein product [Phytophthora fragariaefolia]
MSANEDARLKLAETRAMIAPWRDAEDYRKLPPQLKLGVVHLLAEALATADSPHTRWDVEVFLVLLGSRGAGGADAVIGIRGCSDHVVEDTLALARHGAEVLAARTTSRCTVERLQAYKQRRDKERGKLDAKAVDLVLTWRCQRFPTQGMPPLELKTNDYLIPEVRALQKAGGSAIHAVAEVNGDALRAEIKRYSKTLRRRVEVRQQELVRDLQRQQREQQEIRDRKRLGFRKGWTHLV